MKGSDYMKLRITFIEEVRNVSYLSEEDSEKVLNELEKYENEEKEDKIVEIVQELYESGDIDIWDNVEEVESLSLNDLELDNFGNNEIETYLKNL